MILNVRKAHGRCMLRWVVRVVTRRQKTDATVKGELGRATFRLPESRLREYLYLQRMSRTNQSLLVGRRPGGLARHSFIYSTRKKQILPDYGMSPSPLPVYLCRGCRISTDGSQVHNVSWPQLVIFIHIYSAMEFSLGYEKIQIIRNVDVTIEIT